MERRGDTRPFGRFHCFDSAQPSNLIAPYALLSRADVSSTAGHPCDRWAARQVSNRVIWASSEWMVDAPQILCPCLPHVESELAQLHPRAIVATYIVFISRRGVYVARWPPAPGVANHAIFGNVRNSQVFSVSRQHTAERKHTRRSPQAKHSRIDDLQV